MKFCAASFFVLIFPVSFTVSQQCITGGFSVLINDLCNYPKLLAAFQDFYTQPFNINPGCSLGAEPLLQSLLGVSDATAGATAVSTICQQAFANFNALPFREIPGPFGTDDFIKKFYNGGTDFNEHVATLFPSLSPGVESFLLSDEASNVGVTFTGEGTYGMIKWPDFVPNFQSCANNAAMCCWPQDRQAGDGNGNCARSYDASCVDADPGDNTDLCYTNLTASATATGYKASNAGITFPYDGQNNQDFAEGPIHCHGLGWADDVNDPTNVYKGNNLFYISMYDHMFKRGYVRNIPGAPMCACLEQMPVVSRADCSQVNVQQNITFKYNGSAFSASVSNIDVVYTACQGIDPYGAAQNNDLWAYLNKLFINNQLASSKLVGASQNLVGSNPNGCPIAEKKFWSSQGFVRGYTVNASNWILLAGTESFSFLTNYGKNGIDLMLNSSANKLIRRVCGSCMDTHKHIFYKRLTPAPANLNILTNLMYSSTIVPGQVYGKDFLLFSTYEDAQDPTNSKAWSCKQINSTFPFWCGPNNQTYDDSPARSWWSQWGAQDVAYYVEAGFPGGTNVSVANIGKQPLPGYAFRYNNKIYVTSTASYYGGQTDNEVFVNTPTVSDFTIIVKVEAFHYASDRGGTGAKAGIQIRESLDPGSRYFAIAVTGGNGIELSYRTTANNWPYSVGGTTSGQAYSPIWFKVNKRLDSFTAYTSQDGATWTLFYQPVNVLSFGLNFTTIQSGLVLTASDWLNQYSEAVFSNFQNNQFYYPSSAPSSSPAPSAIRTKTSIDINLQNPTMVGSSYFYTRTGLWKVKSGGSDIWNIADSFTFVPFNATNTNLVVQTFIPSYQPASSWSKAGVMIRDSLYANATNVNIILTGSQGVGMQWRPSTGAGTQQTGFPWPAPGLINTWVRLVKINDTITGYKKSILPDSEWILVGSANVTFTNPTLYVGLALSSNNWNTYTTAKFQWFSVNTTIPGK